ncbi:MAG: NTP/NDP exchange transporter [Gemmatimonadaceae bacterium]
MSSGTAQQTSIARALQHVVDVRHDEVRAMLWSCAYFFFVLSSYYVIRPLREEMGVAGGVRNIPWLFTGTLTAMLLVHPPFAALVVRFPRRRFVAIANRFFLANLLAFFVLLRLLPEGSSIWVGRAFFVWTSVFNLFVVSVFWSVLADVFSTPQGKRLFGFIGVGGTLGGITGSAVAAAFASGVGPVNLVPVSMLLLELSTVAMRRVTRHAAPRAADSAGGAGAGSDAEGERIIGGATFSGVVHVLRSPYLLGMCLYMLLFTFGSTVLYIQQAAIAERTYADPGARTAFFARIDLAVNTLTLLTQAFLTGRIVKALGVPLTLTLLPALSAAGFIALGAMPFIAVLVILQVLRRAGEFAVARPTREVLYIVLPREDKYKAKNLIDTFVYRAGDQIGAWSTAGLAALGMTLAGIAFAAAPLAVAWLAIGFWLGRRQEALARHDGRGTGPATPRPRGSPGTPLEVAQ